jgi:hypothetical protein
VDRVEDVQDISGTSRFISGGIGGITSQLSKSSHYIQLVDSDLRFLQVYIP